MESFRTAGLNQVCTRHRRWPKIGWNPSNRNLETMIREYALSNWNTKKNRRYNDFLYFRSSSQFRTIYLVEAFFRPLLPAIVCKLLNQDPRCPLRSNALLRTQKCHKFRFFHQHHPAALLLVLVNSRNPCNPCNCNRPSTRGGLLCNPRSNPCNSCIPCNSFHFWEDPTRVSPACPPCRPCRLSIRADFIGKKRGRQGIQTGIHVVQERE